MLIRVMNLQVMTHSEHLQVQGAIPCEPAPQIPATALDPDLSSIIYSPLASDSPKNFAVSNHKLLTSSPSGSENYRGFDSKRSTEAPW